MSRLGYILLTVGVLLALIVIFIVSFILYVKTPVPKGCKKQSSDLCSSCPNKRCEYYLYEPKGKLKEKEEIKENEDESNL